MIMRFCKILFGHDEARLLNVHRIRTAMILQDRFHYEKL